MKQCFHYFETVNTSMVRRHNLLWINWKFKSEEFVP